MLPLLLNLRFHLNRLFWQHTGMPQRIVIAIFFLIMFGCMIGVGVFTYWSFRFLLTGNGGTELLIYALFIGLSLLFALMCLSSMVTMSMLAYQSSDLSFFFSLPLSPEDVVKEKLLENMVLSGWASVIFGLPMLLSFGLVVSAGAAFYIVAAFSLVFLTALAVLFGSFLTIVAYRLVGQVSRGVLWVIYALGTVVTLRLMALAILPDIARIASILEQGRPFQLQTIAGSAARIFPSYALALAIGRTVAVPAPLWPLLWLTLGTLALIAISRYAMQNWYMPGWQRTQKFLPAVKTLQGTKFLSKRILLLERREILQAWREVRQASQVVFTLILVAFYTLVVAFVGRAHDIPADWQRMILVSVVGVAGYVIATIALRFLFPTMSLEGQAAWLLWSFPYSLRQILRAKWIVHIVFLVLISLLLACIPAFLLHIDMATKLQIFFHLVVISLFVTAIQLGIGIAYPNFHESDPGTLSSTGPGLSATFLSLAIVSVDLMLLNDVLRLQNAAVSLIVPVVLTLLAFILLKVWFVFSFHKARHYTF